MDGKVSGNSLITADFNTSHALTAGLIHEF